MFLEFENAATQGNYFFFLRVLGEFQSRTSLFSHSLYTGQGFEGWHSSTPAQCVTMGTLRLDNSGDFPLGLTGLDKFR